MNRDIANLRRVPCIMADIEALERRIRWERDRMTNITTHLSLCSGGRGRMGIDDALSAIYEIDGEHKQLCERYRAELKNARDIMARVPNGKQKTAIWLYYVEREKAETIRRKLKISDWKWRDFIRRIETVDAMEKVAWPKWEN